MASNETTTTTNNNNNNNNNNTAEATAATATLVASKRVVYVGGLGEDVSPQILRAAMIPFGTIKSLDVPMDYKIGKTRGFAFVEFDDPDDGACLRVCVFCVRVFLSVMCDVCVCLHAGTDQKRDPFGWDKRSGGK